MSQPSIAVLGLSGLRVSRLCFGTLTLGPLQKDMAPDAAAGLIREAFQLGVTFFDTAELYETYPLLNRALAKNSEPVIASRSYAVTYGQMAASIEKARRELNRDYIDIFGLHEIESGATLKGHAGALEYLCHAKARGLIKAIGISTHTVAGVRAAATNPVIDVIHPLLNRDGIGIRDGSVAEMTAALETAAEFGKGIYAMKVLAGGHLCSQAREAFRFVNGLPWVDAIAVGMQSRAEILLNLALVAGRESRPELWESVASSPRGLTVSPWCQGCGRCVARCGFGALRLEEGKARVIAEKCMRCGYCAKVCPEFCLKVC